MEFFLSYKTYIHIYICCIRNIFIVVLLGMVVSSKPTLFPFLHSLLFLCDKVCKYVCTFIAGIFLFGYSLTSSFNTVPPLSILKLYFLLWACELRSVVNMIVCLVLYPRPVRNATVPCDWLTHYRPRNFRTLIFFKLHTHVKIGNLRAFSSPEYLILTPISLKLQDNSTYIY